MQERMKKWVELYTNRTSINAWLIMLLLLEYIFFPFGTMHRNPPYHLYGGFDIRMWQIVLAFNVISLSISVACILKHKGHLLLRFGAFSIFVFCTGYLILYYVAVLEYPAI